MKQKSVFVCTECGSKSPKWMGKCTVCGKWNTMEEEITAPEPKAGSIYMSTGGIPRKIKDIDISSEVRVSTGMSAFWAAVLLKVHSCLSEATPESENPQYFFKYVSF